MKMPTIVDTFIIISRENFMLSWIEHEKSFITSGPDQTARMLGAHVRKLMVVSAETARGVPKIYASMEK